MSYNNSFRFGVLVPDYFCVINSVKIPGVIFCMRVCTGVALVFHQQTMTIYSSGMRFNYSTSPSSQQSFPVPLGVYQGLDLLILLQHINLNWNAASERIRIWKVGIQNSRRRLLNTTHSYFISHFVSCI